MGGGDSLAPKSKDRKRVSTLPVYMELPEEYVELASQLENAWRPQGDSCIDNNYLI